MSVYPFVLVIDVSLERLNRCGTRWIKNDYETRICCVA